MPHIFQASRLVPRNRSYLRTILIGSACALAAIFPSHAQEGEDESRAVSNMKCNTPAANVEKASVALYRIYNFLY